MKKKFFQILKNNKIIKQTKHKKKEIGVWKPDHAAKIISGPFGRACETFLESRCHW